MVNFSYKKNILISIALTILLVGSMMIPVNSMNDENLMSDPVKVNQSLSDISRPIFVNITSTTANVQTVRERNETLGLGAQVKAEINKNVTITYKVMNGLNQTDYLRFFADVPGNYSLTNVTETLAFEFDSVIYQDITWPYTGHTYINASVSYYTLEFNVSNPLIPFYAAIGSNSEDSLNSPHNFITTDQYWSAISEDDFYIQDDPVLINLNGYFLNTSEVFGIKYREATETEYIYLNFTNLVFTGVNATAQIDLGAYEPGTTLYFESIMFIGDRSFERLDYQTIEIGDGTPTFSIDILSNTNNSKLIGNSFYSTNGTVVFEFSATVLKGNISLFVFEVEGVAADPFTPSNVNVSTQGEAMTYVVDFANNTKTNVTVIAETNKDLKTNETFTIYIDNVLPTLTLDKIAGADEYLGGYQLTTENGIITFSFEFADDNAGVYMAVLDLGDGVSVEVTSLSNYTHTYTNLNSTNEFIVKLTIIDFAGNFDSTKTFLTVIYDDTLEVTSTPSNSLYLIIALTVIAVIYFLPIVINFVREKINR